MPPPRGQRGRFQSGDAPPENERPHHTARHQRINHPSLAPVSPTGPISPAQRERAKNPLPPPEEDPHRYRPAGERKMVTYGIPVQSNQSEACILGVLALQALATITWE